MYEGYEEIRRVKMGKGEGNFVSKGTLEISSTGYYILKFFIKMVNAKRVVDAFVNSRQKKLLCLLKG